MHVCGAATLQIEHFRVETGMGSRLVVEKVGLRDDIGFVVGIAAISRVRSGH